MKLVMSLLLHIKENNSLVKLWMSGIKIHAESALCLVQALHFNDTLTELTIPNYPDDVRKNIKSMQHA